LHAVQARRRAPLPRVDRTEVVSLAYIDLFAFSTDPHFVRNVVGSGAAGVVVDWERRGKRRRQAGVDTQVNEDTPAHLATVRAATSGRVLCRVNGWGPWTPGEIDLAVSLGADEVLLPMVREVDEVDAAFEVVAGRSGLGILVETTDAVRAVELLVSRPLSRVYLGLNDLMVDRGGRCLFAPLVDGTADRVRAATAGAGHPFGVAGLTRPDAGHPVPCRLLVGELARVGASFTFLRRSFHADTAGRPLSVEVPRILEAVRAAGRRPADDVRADRDELTLLVGQLDGAEAAAV
jgi:HpcH/HpaI aldolase/citrate lyase family